MHSSGRVIPSSFRRFTCFDLRFEAAAGESHGGTPASPPTSPSHRQFAHAEARTKAAYSRSTSKRPELRQHTSDRAVRVPSGFDRRAAALTSPADRRERGRLAVTPDVIARDRSVHAGTAASVLIRRTSRSLTSHTTTICPKSEGLGLTSSRGHAVRGLQGLPHRGLQPSRIEDISCTDQCLR